MSEQIGQLPGQQFYCRLKIKGVEIASSNIISLTIREWVLDVLPKIELSIADMGGLLEVATLEDNDEIEVSISKHSESETQLNMTFLLSDYSISIISDNRMLNINIVGYMKVNDMFTTKTRCFNQSSSIDVLKKISTEAGLKFNNPMNVLSNDKMNWYQCNSNFDFIKHILKRAYIFNDVMFFYADHSNKFNITSLNKEMDKKENRISKFDVSQTEFKKDKNDTTIYYNAYDIVNMSGYFNKTNNYGRDVTYFDSKEMKTIEYNTINKITDLTFMDKNFYKKNVNGIYAGISDTDNIYSEKYFESLIRNDYLVKNFFGYSVVIQIDSECDVKLFDKINLVIPSLVSEEFNEVYSGMYLVGGIIHNVCINGIYKKMLSLHRNGMNKSEFVKTTRVVTI